MGGKKLLFLRNEINFPLPLFAATHLSLLLHLTIRRQRLKFVSTGDLVGLKPRAPKPHKVHLKSLRDGVKMGAKLGAKENGCGSGYHHFAARGSRVPSGFYCYGCPTE